MDERLRIAVTLPYHFTVRDFLFTPVWQEMEKRTDAHFYLLSDDAETIRIISERDCPSISAPAPVTANPPKSLLQRIAGNGSPAGIWTMAFRWLDDKYLYDSLGHRFAVINGLSYLRVHKMKSAEEKKIQRFYLIYRRGEYIGQPCPGSKPLFHLLYRLRHGCLNTAGRDYITLLQNLKPDVFVFGRVQFPVTAHWGRALHSLGIPMIGILASWDHPTIQGPLSPGMSGYMVASRRMAEELTELHGIDPAKVCQVGKVQMDQYLDPTTFSSRQDFFKEMGIPSEHRLITFGTNNTGLKEHEVSIARKLSQDFINSLYGKATLLLRTHPQDVNWERDFLSLEKPPWVRCFSAASFGNRKTDSLSIGQDDQVILANLMKYSDLVIQSRGSMALDAIAFNTPVISLAFDGDMPRSPNDSFLMEYEYEHYKPLVKARGTWLVGSYQELDRAISGYLSDPSIHNEGRKIIREEHIEPLDGKASQRLVDYLVESAGRARAGSLPAGDWGHTGLGDVTWASRQICNVQDYVQK
jgi:hypothetical protein